MNSHAPPAAIVCQASAYEVALSLGWFCNCCPPAAAAATAAVAAAASATSRRKRQIELRKKREKRRRRRERSLIAAARRPSDTTATNPLTRKATKKTRLIFCVINLTCLRLCPIVLLAIAIFVRSLVRGEEMDGSDRVEERRIQPRRRKER